MAIMTARMAVAAVPAGQTRRADVVDRHYTGSATVRQSDFGMTPIRIAGGTVQVKDDVKIDFDIVAGER